MAGRSNGAARQTRPRGVLAGASGAGVWNRDGLDYLAITKLDVLDSLKSIKLCTGYKVDGKILNYLPSDPELIVKIEPVYEEMEGWNTSISGVRQYNDLPDNAKKYLHRIEEITGVEILMVSVGPRRKETIWKKRLS